MDGTVTSLNGLLALSDVVVVDVEVVVEAEVDI